MENATTIVLFIRYLRDLPLPRPVKFECRLVAKQGPPSAMIVTRVIVLFPGQETMPHKPE